MYDDFYNVIGFIEYFRLIYCFAKKIENDRPSLHVDTGDGLFMRSSRSTPCSLHDATASVRTFYAAGSSVKAVWDGVSGRWHGAGVKKIVPWQE